MQYHSNERRLFHRKKKFESYSLKIRIYGTKSSQLNQSCQSNLEEQRKSYIKPNHKYIDQNYRLEDSICIFMFIK